ncbi:Penicillin acylase family protein [Stigmatella aurantiaca DW4/3-1]|uniref:Aculeacin A acylase n=1 Tax=Stigmatella aurantiaca (strain DW4/3-1) TaxID=378806 RepID=Q08TJ2_STIAD|nr:Penicillin acylase family protein [Stigmatella aurantiaca DW4/3-1]EAU63801.1 aculeacin A acylase [Stigmatella aurantiaca DW4/3-1]
MIALAGCGEEDSFLEPSAHRYEAEIRYTPYGIPHIQAKNLRGAGFGQGYALARDHACTLVDQIIKVRGERARYHGPGLNDAYVSSDFAYRALGLVELAQASIYRQPAAVQELMGGFVTGFNRFLSEPEAEGLPCAKQPWLGPLSLVDLMAYHRSLAMQFGSGRLLGAIAAAQPPTAQGIQWEPVESPFVEAPPASLGSNGWALGAERTAGGRGMLLANPHFPWDGELRLWESHLTVPGQLDVYGASLLGVPGVLIGFNQNVAWTHTVSSAGARLTAYVLKLVPGKPTSYLFDGTERQMSSSTLSIQVLQADGSLQSVTRTYYSSHYGPIISLPGAGWTADQAFTFRDANFYNETLIAQFLGMNTARSMKEFQDVFDTVQGIPWVHTMASDRDGNVWYTDAAATANVGTATLLNWQKGLSDASSLQATLLRSGLILLDGSTSRDEWVPAQGARIPGLTSPAMAPRLGRRDVVFNSNDSHWLPHPSAVLEGFSPLQGAERTARSVRTRMNAHMLEEVREGGASGADGRFTLEELQTAVFSNRSFTAEMLRESVVQRCQLHPEGTVQGQKVALAQACAVLASWDGRFDAGLAGPAVWREFIAGFPSTALTSAGPLFSTPFSATAPVSTPSTLVPAPASDPDPVLNALASAVLTLQRAGIAVETPLGQVQFAPRLSQRIPLSGGLEQDGVLNLVNYNNSLNSSTEPPTPRGTVLNSRTALTADGYVINSGSSFVLALEFLDEGVRARALLTYGETGNPASPGFRDQLPLYSALEWRPVAFSPQEIASEQGGSPLFLTQD